MSGVRAAGALAFDTVLGRCVIAWTEAGVTELHLADPADRIRRLGRGAAPAKAKATRRPKDEARSSGAIVPVTSPRGAPPWIRKVVKRIQRHLDGHLDDLLDVPVAWPADASAFDVAIWEAARNVPPGLTISYGELADEIGHPGAARAAGSAMRKAPVALLVPAHRVIAAGKRPGGWTGAGGVPVKLRLLEIEGVALKAPRRKATGRRRGGSR